MTSIPTNQVRLTAKVNYLEFTWSRLALPGSVAIPFLTILCWHQPVKVNRNGSGCVSPTRQVRDTNPWEFKPVRLPLSLFFYYYHYHYLIIIIIVIIISVLLVLAAVAVPVDSTISIIIITITITMITSSINISVLHLVSTSTFELFVCYLLVLHHCIPLFVLKGPQLK